MIDIVSARGNERIVDLNMPLPDNLRLRFDLVIDTGTCEHCFNVAQAFMNSCQALAIGGYLVHAAPINKCNHGFWNFCPGVYPDFLGDNGFEIIYMSGILFSLSVCKQSGKVREELKTFKISPFDRFKLPTESIIYVVASVLTMFLCVGRFNENTGNSCIPRNETYYACSRRRSSAFCGNYRNYGKTSLEETGKE